MSTLTDTQIEIAHSITTEADFVEFCHCAGLRVFAPAGMTPRAYGPDSCYGKIWITFDQHGLTTGSKMKQGVYNSDARGILDDAATAFKCAAIARATA